MMRNVLYVNTVYGLDCAEEGKPIEKRTPVLLREENYDAWLNAPVEKAMQFMGTFEADELVAEPTTLVV